METVLEHRVVQAVAVGAEPWHQGGEVAGGGAWRPRRVSQRRKPGRAHGEEPAKAEGKLQAGEEPGPSGSGKEGGMPDRRAAQGPGKTPPPDGLQ